MTYVQRYDLAKAFSLITSWLRSIRSSTASYTSSGFNPSRSIEESAEEGIRKACEKTQAVIKEFTAAPIFMEGNKKGAHEWIIEFEKKPDNIEAFANILDESVQELKSDYEA